MTMCTKCSLCNKSKRINNLQGSGTGSSGIMIIAEAPNASDEVYRTPFSGANGAELDTFINQLGFKRQDCYLTYLVKCRIATPTGDNGAVLKEYINGCSAYLDAEIQAKKPKYIIIFGEKVLQFFVPKAKMADKRGLPLMSTKYNCMVFPTYNPAVKLNTNKFDNLIKKDILTLRNLINGVDTQRAKKNYVYATSIDIVKDIRDRVMFVPRMALDIETTGLSFHDNELISISFSWKKDTGVCIPLHIKDTDRSYVPAPPAKIKPENYEKYYLDYMYKHPKAKPYWGDKQEEVITLLKQILKSPCAKGGHNSFFDVSFLQGKGFEVTNYDFDTIIMHHLLDEEGLHGLDSLSWVFTDSGGYKLEKKKYLRGENDCYLNIPLDVLMPYNIADADVTFQLYDIFKAKLEEQDLWGLFVNHSMPLQKVLIDVGVEGTLIDKDYLWMLRDNFNTEIETVVASMTKRLNRYFPDGVSVVANGEEAKKLKKEYKDDPKHKIFNLNSDDDIRDIFFTKCGYTSSVLTDSGEQSVAKEVLKEFAKKNKLAEDLLVYRRLTKITSTYCDSILGKLDKTNRIHTTFKVHGTKTGRLASENPNSQNFPRDIRIRRMIIPREGCAIVEIDESQCELRVLAGLSGDPVMCDIYKKNGDIHREVASTYFNVPIDKVTKEQRTVAKSVNFGIAYGISPYALKELLKGQGITITDEQAISYIRGWFKKFKVAYQFLNKAKADFFNNGELVTLFKRKRRCPKVRMDKARYKALQREAQNYVIQSTASDFVSMLTIKLYPLFKQEGISLKYTVHDSMILEVPFDKIERLKQLVRDNTTLILPELNNVPLIMDFKVGLSWGTAKEGKIDEPTDIDKLCNISKDEVLEDLLHAK